MPREAKNYAAIKRQFILWLASDELDRSPTTQRAFAERCGVDEATLSDWKTPEFMAKVNELVDRHLADDYAMAVGSLKRNVRKGSYQHTQLYLQMIGKYVPKIAPVTPDGKQSAVPQLIEYKYPVDDGGSSDTTEGT